MDALFLGFGIVTVLLLLPYRFYGKELQMHVNRIVNSITRMMPVVALLYVSVFLGFVMYELLYMTNGNGTLIRMQGPYGIAYIFKVLIVPLCIGLLWIKAISKRKSLVFLIAVFVGFFFIIMNERFIIFITSVHRDFLPPMTKDYEYDIFYFFGRFLLEQVVIFCMLLIPFHFFRIQKMASVIDQNN
jgi:hypothetical protein